MKKLEETRVLVDDIWKNFRNTNKYEIENVMDCLAYILHLQYILYNFDSIFIQTYKFLIWQFWKTLSTFIHAKLKKKNSNPDNWQLLSSKQ